jgi:K+-transporting ATPase A subunit
MTKNMGIADRIIRTIVALVVIILLITGKISGALAVILGIVAAVFLLTSAIGWCPLYLPLKISTKKAEKK